MSDAASGKKTILDAGNRRKLAENYVGILGEFIAKAPNNKQVPDAVKSSFCKENVSISKRSLADALAEANKDLMMLNNRREHGNISVGKIAGIIVFRLSRWNIISLADPLIDDLHAIKLNYLVPLALAYKHILEVDFSPLPPAITLEIHYTLTRRHTNQESLGVCFDLLHHFLTPPSMRERSASPTRR